ncbi:hypothetical protein GCM10011375_09560 [Hymenobacter qilianensis]|uniref:Uncharacterized protein n=2 Tax=Hymenobacter qilianensis TaxID=1385715 RepID=A0ACB5PNK9_9BACT|nr:hypothetical protein [Hymenobacter qilianensis]QNP53438.1 hypothetical protein H9L05_07600 [Hymenobacter qilianensis]GGF56523.1 hypothetical protein GCM10011375_09560 [Hymenobacter qilianensis]
MNHNLISLSAPEMWSEALKDIPHSFSHTWQSCYAMHLTTDYDTYLYNFVSNDIKVLCPIAIREYKGVKDVVTPYGFSGFIGNRSCLNFPNYWKKFAYECGWVSGYIGLNPILENPSYYAEEDVFEYNELYIINLRLTMEELFQNLSTNRRRQLKTFSDKSQNFTLDKNVIKEFFLNNYHQFFAERNASSVYNFSENTLSYIIELDNVIMVGYSEGSKMQAVSLFAYTLHGAEYLFNISLPEGRDKAVPLIWFGVSYLKSLNIPTLNLGGGVQRNDSIAQFKQRFGAVICPLRCLKQVYNEPVYSQLCLEISADPSDKTGYFPAYRERT